MSQGFPQHWSETARRIFTDKYLHETDANIYAAIDRVATTVANGDAELAGRLYQGLCAQRYSFNSPVWFNAGIEGKPQCHACFIQGVEDDMQSILDLAVKEGQLFKYGSGTGTNLSALRGEKEAISGGGSASGPVSFMRVYDAVAGTVKSGGKTRRAAKMQILDIDHPDIREFIHCKMREERKALDLIEAGYDPSFDGEAYGSVFFQNSNLSVRVTDQFMEAAADGSQWNLTARTTGQPIASVPARELLEDAALAAWHCGDPGIQFHDTINAWHTCPNDGPIVASNPCSEYMFLEETACNLASLNLVAYLREDDSFDVDEFVKDVYDLVLACDNIIDIAGYPTPAIEAGSLRYRTIGIGYTNLGCLLEKMGLAYSSQDGRNFAAALTALMHFAALNASTKLAQVRSPFPAYDARSYGLVVQKHINAAEELQYFMASNVILNEAIALAHDAEARAAVHGVRNAQLTVLAPTGTISFIMDCETTGIEPYFARRYTKQLVGGGTIEMEYDVREIASEIHWRNHVKMMAACQPFLSGAISKTVNMAKDATVEDIVDCYEMAHFAGLKAIAVYRDGCKGSQPLSTKTEAEPDEAPVTSRVSRTSLPATRPAVTHKFSIGGHDGYFTVGEYDDGRPGELFVKIAREGSTISGLLDAWAIGVSLALQYGVPVETVMAKHEFSRFEPAGVTDNPSIPMAHSIVDYIARWMLTRYAPTEEEKFPGAIEALAMNASRKIEEYLFAEVTGERSCPDCGSLLQRTGTCYSCATCGYNGGCG
jgi:ribonucleoside-diphosphate reductase alpha chain